MRKLLSLTLCLLAYAFCAVAQQTHWSYQEGQYENETFVYADVTICTETLNGIEESTLTTLKDYDAYEYAAFVEGDLRGVATIFENNKGETVTYLLRFRIEGGADDLGGTITFKAYDRLAAREFELNPMSEQPVFTGETLEPGIPHNPMHLQIFYPLESTPVSSITTPFIGFNTDTGAFAYIECNVGDDLTSYFVDGKAFNVLPADASNKSVSYDLEEGNQSLVIDKEGKISVATTGAGMIRVTSVDNPQASCVVFVIAYNDYKTISVSPSEVSVTYKDQPVDVSELLMSVVALGPEGCQTIGGEMTIVSSDPEVLEINDQGAYAKKAGVAVLTFTLPVINRLTKTFYPNDNYTTYSIATLTVVVVQGVTGLQVVWPTDMATDREATFTVTPLPAGATLNPDGLFTLSEAYSNMDINSEGMLTLTKNVEDDTYTGKLTPTVPGMVTLTIAYDGMDGTQLTSISNEIEVGYTFTMTDGWQWCAVPYADFALVKDMKSVFGNELVELRTQSSQIYNDPVYGYFGDVVQLSQSQCFKLKMDSYDSDKSYVFFGGTLGGMDDEPTMRKGWSYMPNPYVQPQYIADVFDTSVSFTDGDRIVSKNDGFVEFNTGKWVGDLTTLQPGEGYLFFNAGNNALGLVYNQEFSPSSARRMAPRLPRQKVWQYDASRFRDNMTIVAELNGQKIMDNSQWTVGAFVGDECRGEGKAIDGRLFITVHANGGEQISFKLRNETTGELFDIDQTVRMQQMLGSVKQPFGMTANADAATGIQNVNRELRTSDYYDLGGRRIDSNGKGILLLRANDGSVRKMMR